MIVDDCKRIDQKLSCFTHINEDCKESDIVFSVKDCISTKGMLSSAGSRILQDYTPVFDATVVSRIKEIGPIIGKTCQDEFGFGSFCKNTYKIPKNPWDDQRSCGGSSGGAACLVAALDHFHIAIAESTGGSISCPSSFCGVVGLTPTYGLVSRYGLIDYANSLDKIGVMARSVRECAFGLTAIAGHDHMDSTSIELKKKDYTEYLLGLHLKIGIPKQYFKGIDPEVADKVWKAIRKLEGVGFECQETSLDMTRYALASYYLIAMTEASTNLARYCGLRYGLSADCEQKGFNEYFSQIRTQGFGDEAKRRIIMGTYARLAGYRNELYLKALKVRTLVINDFKKAFKDVDVLAAPTMPILPPKFSEIEGITPAQEYQSDVLTVPINLAGMPHISIPCGFVNGLPVGFHIMGDHFQEEKIIELAYVYEKQRGELNYPKV